MKKYIRSNHRQYRAFKGNWMVRYGICGLLILVTAVVCFAAGFLATAPRAQHETVIPNTTLETETVTEHQLVINQKEVEPISISTKEQFYLVSETGYLLVFAQDQSTICLHTHIPITEFPEKEQRSFERECGFSSMMEIFHYLESYTS